MSLIEISCNDQALIVTNSPVIASGGSLENQVEFDFSNHWNTYIKTAVFWHSEDDTYYEQLDENNRCYIPDEVLAKDGWLKIGVFGELGNIVRTSEVLQYKIVKGVMTSDESNAQDTPDPTPSVYARLLASYQEVKEDCEDLQDNKVDKVTGATAGHVAILDATGNIQDGGAAASDIELNVPGLNVITDAANVDLFTIYDSSAGILKKITFASLVAAIKTAISNFFAKTENYTVTATAGSWGTSAPYSQTVEAAGILETDSPIPGIVYGSNANDNAAIKTAWACVDRITTAANSVTFFCFEDEPETDITVRLKVVR